jgi:hypothetical protein
MVKQFTKVDYRVSEQEDNYLNGPNYLQIIDKFYIKLATNPGFVRV